MSYRVWFLLLSLLGLVGCGSVPSGGSASAPRLAARVSAAATVGLRAGWNAVAFPAPQLGSLDPNPQIPGMAWFDGVGYQVVGFTAADVNQGQGGRRGFWVYAQSATSMSYDAAPSSPGPLSLRSGWNLVSLASLGEVSSFSGARLQVAPPGSVLPAFSEIQADGSYVTVDVSAGGTLQGTRPYWVFARSEATLTLAPAPSPSPGSSEPPVLPGLATLRFLNVPPTVTAGAPLNLQVEALDQFGQRLSSPGSVQLSALGLTGTSLVALNQGLASFSGLALTRSGSVALTATLNGVTASAAISVTPGPAAALGFRQQPTSGTAGVAINPTVQVVVRDALGNDVPPPVPPVTVTLASNTNDGTLLNKTATTDPVTGVATFTTLQQTFASTGYTLTASGTSLTSATSDSFTVAAASSNQLAFASTTPTSLTAGTGGTITVELQDAFGNLDASATNSVTLAITTAPSTPTMADLDTGTTGTQTSLTVTASGGQASFTVLPNNVGSWTLTASSAGVVTNPTCSFAVTVGPASSLNFVPGAPTSGTFGTAVDTFSVAVYDAFGNERSSTTGTVTIDNGAGEGTLSGNSTTFGSPTAGRGTFTGLTLTLTAPESSSLSQTLTANFGALTRAVTFVFKQLGEFRVNTTTAGDQTGTASVRQVARASNGRFVAVWQSSDGDGWGVYAQRYDANGVPVGSQFQVNVSTVGDQQDPAVAMDANGNFIVAWSSPDGNGSGVFYRRYDADGVAASASDTQVNGNTMGEQNQPSVAAWGDGGGVSHAVVTYSTDVSGTREIAARRIEATAGIIGNFRVNTTTAGHQQNSSVATDASGNFVVTWESEGQDGDGSGIYFQRCSEAGVTQGGETRVNATVMGDQTFPSVSRNGTGDFVVAWTSTDGNGDGVYATRFSTAGVAQSGEIAVNTSTAGDQNQASVALGGSGNYTVVWTGAADVYARRYNAADVAQGTEFRVNTTVAGDQSLPSVGVDGSGNFVVLWTSAGQDGSGAGIYARRYQANGTAGP